MDNEDGFGRAGQDLKILLESLGNDRKGVLAARNVVAYSPFAGVWLDRWSRRQVLLRANVLRAGLVALVAALVFGGVQGTAFYAAGLAVFSVNRFGGWLAGCQRQASPFTAEY